MGKSNKKVYGNGLLSFMENSEFVIAMRRGLLLCIPFFIIGSFCTLMISFPAESYQIWIKTVGSGWVYKTVLLGYNVTLGSVTLYLILAVSYCYGCQVDEDGDELGFYVLTSVVSYMLFAQKSAYELSFDIFNANWLFTGSFVTLFSCFLFKRLHRLFGKYIKNKFHIGMDMDFAKTVIVIIPVIGIVMVWLLLKLILGWTFGWNINNVGSVLMMKLFETIGTGLLGAVVFIVLIHIMWFFGIHGSNMLSMVSIELFEKGMLDNIAFTAAGGEPVNIFTKTFFDVFVLMGGSGTTICLLIALLLRKNRRDRALLKISILPALFNINEIVLFGLPVVFNPILFIPFVIVPLVMTGLSAVCMFTGLVPAPSVQVIWTTPIIFSGYLCTGSISGSVLQIVLIAVGTAIYMPFIKLSETYYDKLLQNNIDSLREEMISCEEIGENINLHKGPRSKRDIVKLLMKNLDTAISNDEIMLYYQPQITSENEIYGVEALLRWKHPIAGFLYPPLVVELARQDNVLDELGLILIEKAAKDLEYLSGKVKQPIHMAVNISPIQFESDQFCPKVEEILKKYDFKDCIMCFEITEQIMLSMTEIISERIERLKTAGILFHMDDFGMGHSSMRYLLSREFDAVKLDGSLVRQMLDNDRSQNIISGIQQMAMPLNYELIAEYVETEAQRKMLKELGCHIYQGYLYSCPIPLIQLEEFLREYKTYK